jgi:hypothetical protein
VDVGVTGLDIIVYNLHLRCVIFIAKRKRCDTICSFFMVLSELLNLILGDELRCELTKSYLFPFS